MIKKIWNFSKTLLIFSIWTCLFLYLATWAMMHFWRFNLLSGTDWQKISYFWNHGGIIKQQKDILFSLNLIILPFVWIFGGWLLFRINYLKLLLGPFNIYNQWKLNKLKKNTKRIVLRNMQSSNKEEESIKAKIESIKPREAKEKENIRRNLSTRFQEQNDENKIK